MPFLWSLCYCSGQRKACLWVSLSSTIPCPTEEILPLYIALVWPALCFQKIIQEASEGSQQNKMWSNLSLETKTLTKGAVRISRLEWDIKGCLTTFIWTPLVTGSSLPAKMALSSYGQFLTSAILKLKLCPHSQLHPLILIHLPTVSQSNASSTWQPFNSSQTLPQKPRKLKLQGTWRDPLGLALSLKRKWFFWSRNTLSSFQMVFQDCFSFTRGSNAGDQDT